LTKGIRERKKGMSVFRDSNGNEWRVALDAFTLDDVRKDAGVDLADLSAGGWATIETDAGAVVRVLAVVCRDEIKARNWNSREFAKGLRGEAIQAGRAALLTEGADFFPVSEWSAIQSNWRKRKANLEQTTDMMTAASLLQAMSAMPPDMRAGAMAAIQEAIASQSSADGGSAGTPDATPEPVATGWPASAESSPAVFH
jgi:hypothetical protein